MDKLWISDRLPSFLPRSTSNIDSSFLQIVVTKLTVINLHNSIKWCSSKKSSQPTWFTIPTPPKSINRLTQRTCLRSVSYIEFLASPAIQVTSLEVSALSARLILSLRITNRQANFWASELLLCQANISTLVLRQAASYTSQMVLQWGAKVIQAK